MAAIAKCFLIVASLCQAMHSKPTMVLVGAQTAALVADGITTRQLLDNCPARYVYCHEADPVARVFIGDRPGWGRMVAFGTGQLLLEVWLGQRMRKSSHVWIRRTWWVPLVAGTALNAVAAARNARFR